MLKYLLRRFSFLLLTLLITSMVVFAVTQLLPGDVARVILGREAGEAALEALREELGLNDPLPVQYGRWLTRFVSGDWGKSYSTKSEIRPLVLGRLRNSLMLAGVILVISVPLAIFLGVIAGLNENRWIDNLISIGSLAVVGLPEFVTGLVLIQIFAFQLKWLPANSTIRPTTSFLEALPMLILPALTATLVLLAYIARLTRAGVIEELKQQYVRTADLKGLPYHTVIFKHVLRNALIPTITVIAISMGWLISGLIVIENVFNYPGLGRLMVFAIDRRDLPLLQAVTMVAVVGFALSNLIADILYALLDPRIRLG
ncbi:MAG: Oligopeptide transport system permease protein OppB [Anaerolineae bacterium]|nr:MAG: Oligopeptide transport system permease protein OppB [Anaerolineae bacterium]